MKKLLLIFASLFVITVSANSQKAEMPDNPAGVPENSAFQKPQVHPNPIQNAFVVTDINNAGNLSFEVYDLNGQAVRPEVKNSTNSQIELSIANLVKGMYVLKVFDENGQVISSTKLEKVD